MGPLFTFQRQCKIGHKSYRKGQKARGPTEYQAGGVNELQQEPEFVVFPIGHVEERVLPKLLITLAY